MKTEEWTSKDGSKSGETTMLEVGDKFVPQYETYRVSNFGGYDNFSIAVKEVLEDGSISEDIIYLKLTPAQAEKLKQAGNVQNKICEAYEYESKKRDGKFIGIKVVG